MSLEATNLVWAGSPHRAEHEPGNLGSDNQAVAELSAETHFQEENSRIANASGNYANLPIDRKHANFAAACVADVTPSTSGALTAATNWAEQMEASETDEDGFTVVKHKRRRRESPSRPVEQRSSGVATSRRTGPTPRRRPPAGGATGVQMIRATRADIADARARQRSSTEDNCVFVEHCPDFGSTHYLQAVEELVGGAGNVLQVMKMDGRMLVGLSTKALAERLIRDGLDIGHTHLRAFPFKKRAERITVGNLPFFVDDAAVIEALKPYGDVTSIVPIRLRAGRYTFTDGRREAFILLKEGIALEKIPTASSSETRIPSSTYIPRYSFRGFDIGFTTKKLFDTKDFSQLRVGQLPLIIVPLYEGIRCLLVVISRCREYSYQTRSISFHSCSQILMLLKFMDIALMNYVIHGYYIPIKKFHLTPYPGFGPQSPSDFKSRQITYCRYNNSTYRMALSSLCSCCYVQRRSSDDSMNFYHRRGEKSNHTSLRFPLDPWNIRPNSG
ncbi:hypothetical protein LAZ67_5002932 [Cordylochernes scorpioides]|uniref:Uncharacterized protein n=1 Tax=Cordylochernes scorpioides TaxID=51811 RepID=A0ABY6KIN3_9ARAC|nr:hypothetical protein LAZ67_5002932 [Cordylochernes scorpioides]